MDSLVCTERWLHCKGELKCLVLRLSQLFGAREADCCREVAVLCSDRYGHCTVTVTVQEAGGLEWDASSPLVEASL